MLLPLRHLDAGEEGTDLAVLAAVAVPKHADALEEGDGVGVASQAAVDDNGHMEARGDRAQRSPCAIALPGDHGVVRLLEDEGPQITSPRRTRPGCAAPPDAPAIVEDRPGPREEEGRRLY